MEEDAESSHSSQRGGHAEGVDFPLLFEASPEVLLVLLPDAPRFTMIAATQARLSATHMTRESFGRGLFEFFPDNPADPQASGSSNLRASLERVLATKQPDTMAVQKYDIRGADGAFESRFWSPKNLPVLSAQGEVLYLLHCVEDVTDLVRASQLGDELRGRERAMEREVLQRSGELAVALRKLRTSNAQLAQLDAAKTVFFSNISHEFRTPLALILGTLEEHLAANAQISPAQTRMQLTAAYRNSLRLLKLVNSLLDFSRIEAGRMRARYQPTNLSVLTAELAGNFDSAVARGGLTLTVDCQPLPEPIYVDHEMWEKIVLNLISNAFKHTFKGGITVRLTSLQGAARLSVEDSGVGIAAQEIPKLFDRFYRVEGAESRTHEGTGIGLALVKELVLLHGGQIQADSEVGRGSRFIVTLQTGTAHLPADQIDHSGAAAMGGALHTAAYLEEARQWGPPEPEATEPAVRPPTIGPRARILWADDNADMRAYVTRLLERSYDVTAVADGQAALEAALASPPDLVLSDVMMPRLNGFGLLRALRADERTRRLPVILVSARAGEESTVAGLDTGADDYLIKPFSAKELLARVRTHVELALQRRSWENELERRVAERTAELNAQMQRMSLLGRITRAIAERQDLRSILKVVISSIEETLPAERCWVGLPGAQMKDSVLAEGQVYEPDGAVTSMQLPKEWEGLDLRSIVTTPLRCEGEMLGMLLVGRREANAFNHDECEFLRQLAEQVAVAARQGRLHESLQAAYDDLHLTQQAQGRPDVPHAPTTGTAEPLRADPKVSSR